MLDEYEDRFTIATPEGVELDLTLAGLGSRFAAALIDALLRILILGALALVLGGTAALTGDIGTGVAAAAFIVAYFLIIFGYDILFEVLASGRTPGKRWNGLRVVRVGGQPVGFLSSAIRNVLRVVDILPGFYAVGCIAILVSQRNQRLGDLAAGTLVVRDPGSPSQEEPWTRRATTTPSAPRATGDVTGITADEIATVRSFLERRSELDGRARTELATVLAERLRPKVGGDVAHLGPETFLEQLAVQKAARGS